MKAVGVFPLGEEAERESTVGDVSGPRKEFESIPVQELDGQTSVPDVIPIAILRLLRWHGH